MVEEGGREGGREGGVGGRDGGMEGGRKEGRDGCPISMEGRAPICISTIRLQIGHLFDEYMHYLHCAVSIAHAYHFTFTLGM